VRVGRQSDGLGSSVNSDSSIINIAIVGQLRCL
jgi:hypothetical protein